MTNLWSNILISNQYQQAKGTLYNGVGHCCMGVLEDACGILFNYEDRAGEYRDEFDSSGMPTTEFTYDYAPHLEDLVTEEDRNAIGVILYEDGHEDWADIISEIVTEQQDFFDGSKVKDALAVLNDNGASFETIARVIVDRSWDVEVSYA